MNQDVGIICFKHCSGSPIFCEKFPQICPICVTAISEVTTVPFKVPNPFTNAIHCPTSIIIRPSSGSFLDNYEYTDDLHIGIVNSKCEIYEYDQRGVILNDINKWTKCISLENIIPESWYEHWDDILINLSQGPLWNCANYHPVHLNCFNFVVEFIKQLNYKDFYYESKEEICRHLILPRIKESLRYIAIYKKLRDNDFYIDSKSSSNQCDNDYN